MIGRTGSLPTREDAMSEWRNICCPVDLTEESHHALREAARLAHLSGAHLLILHVLKGAGLTGAEPVFAPPPHRAPPEPQGSDARLQDWAAEAERTTGRPVTSVRIQGHAADEILRFATEQACDLIVLGKHARAGTPRVFRRSVAEMVARRAAVPVLLVPAAQASDAGKAV